MLSTLREARAAARFGRGWLNSAVEKCSQTQQANHTWPSPWSQPRQTRSMHASRVLAVPKTENASKDTRLAGRIRFYKELDVVEVPAPWDQGNEDGADDDAVASPISAGVDGTDSASGVQRPTAGDNRSQLRAMLQPRTPGTEIASDAQNETQWFGVSLDGRTLKTPMGQALAVPSQSLAFAIAAEWDAQKKYLQPAQMPLMTMTCTALDQVSMHPVSYQEQALNYLTTDTTCFWADPTEDRVLHRRQQEAWDGLHSFVKQHFESKPSIALGAGEALAMSRKRKNKPNAGLPHPDQLYERAKEYTVNLDAWHLVALHAVCMQAKSFFVGVGMLEKASPLDVKKAVEASRVEEEFQISIWGLVEGGHDYDRLNCSIQLGAAQILLQTIRAENEV